MYLDLFFRTLVVTLVPDWVYLPLHLVPQPNHIPPSHTLPSSALSSHSSFIRPSHSFFIRSPQSLFLHPLSPATPPPRTSPVISVWSPQWSPQSTPCGHQIPGPIHGKGEGKGVWLGGGGGQPMAVSHPPPVINKSHTRALTSRTHPGGSVVEFTRGPAKARFRSPS